MYVFTLRNPLEPVNLAQVPEQYMPVDFSLQHIDDYSPIVLDNDLGDYNIPEDHKKRYTWFKHLLLSQR